MITKISNLLKKKNFYRGFFAYNEKVSYFQKIQIDTLSQKFQFIGIYILLPKKLNHTGSLNISNKAIIEIYKFLLSLFFDIELTVNKSILFLN